MCMFSQLKNQYSRSDNVVYLSDYIDPVPRRYMFDDSVRFCGRVAHKSVQAVLRKVYLWNKIADSR